jgi:hypothetical protein
MSAEERNDFKHKYSNRDREVLSNSDTYSELRSKINKPTKDQERPNSQHMYAHKTQPDSRKVQLKSVSPAQNEKPFLGKDINLDLPVDLTKKSVEITPKTKEKWYIEKQSMFNTDIALNMGGESQRII